MVKPVKDFSHMPPRRQAVNQNHMTQEQIKAALQLDHSDNKWVMWKAAISTAYCGERVLLYAQG